MPTFETIKVKAKMHANCVVGNYFMIKVKNNTRKRSVQGAQDSDISEIRGIVMVFLSVRFISPRQDIWDKVF